MAFDVETFFSIHSQDTEQPQEQRARYDLIERHLEGRGVYLAWLYRAVDDRKMVLAAGVPSAIKTARPATLLRQSDASGAPSGKPEEIAELEVSSVSEGHFSIPLEHTVRMVDAALERLEEHLSCDSSSDE